MKTNTKLIDRLIGCGGRPWSDVTALECGEMVHVGTLTRRDTAPPPGTFRQPVGLRLSRAVFEDCRGSRRIICQIATDAAEDGPGRPARRVRLLAPVRGKGGTRCAVVELVARSRGGWVEVRMGGEG
ncbi:MAG: hypothetical protein M0037_14305 [Betaproteobacteria bacterium]|nr:hypothetical protein [Betaproteobacteria bacterium]